MTVEVVFWVSVALSLYVYAGYPLVLLVLARVRRRPVLKAAREPRVSILIAAYNEAPVMEAKVRNSLELDYPADRIEIVIACDGCTDGTPDIVRRFSDPRVRLLDYQPNRGKLAVLNDTVPRLAGEIVVFTDAASMLAPDAIRRLTSAFADPAIGAVGGLYTVRKAGDSKIGGQEDLYWKYETFLKRQEAAIDSTIGAHGALYAIRRELYPFPQAGTINDDCVIPLGIIRQGYRVIYEPAAVAWEEARHMDGFGRRVRIMTGNFQQLREVKHLLRPLRLLPLLFFLSRKAGRLAVPIAMLAALGANLLLLDRPFYEALAWCQAAFYALVALGALRAVPWRLLRLPYYFCMVNAAAFWGMYHALTARRRLAWK